MLIKLGVFLDTWSFSRNVQAAESKLELQDLLPSTLYDMHAPPRSNGKFFSKLAIFFFSKLSYDKGTFWAMNKSEIPSQKWDTEWVNVCLSISGKPTEVLVKITLSRVEEFDEKAMVNMTEQKYAIF